MAGKKTVLLGVTGSIAAYKAVELLRLLQKRGLTVKVAMTPAACEFVTPLTFQTLSGFPVASAIFDESVEWKAAHVSLADEANCIVVAPATADFIAKLAYGLADDILASTILASDAPLVIAPAMHAGMLDDAATQANLKTLADRGALIVEPEEGELASGDAGPGRLAALEKIVQAVAAETEATADLEGKTVVVTAGGTQEPLDPVRYIGNRSSGKTGFAIAAEAARRGAAVVLISGPTELSPPRGVELVRIMTASEMHAAVLERYEAADAIVMTAAVADFAPSEAREEKLKKEELPEFISLQRNPDILAELGSRKGGKVLVGFAAETRNVLENARGKLEAKNLDMIVANDVSKPGVGFGSDENEVTLVTRDGEEDLPRMSKTRLAKRIAGELASLLNR